MPEFKHVVVVSDGIRGHYHQSSGIAEWINRLSGAKFEDTINIPKFSGLKKITALKLSAHKLKTGDKTAARDWLQNLKIDFNADLDTLFISAGSSAAPFCLAMARATDNKCAVIMTPSMLGTKPFDYAIIPEHDPHDPLDPKIFTTLGAPNHIYIPDIKDVGRTFFSGKNFMTEKIVALLIGGTDANYNPNAEWAKKVLLYLANVKDITILLTTSRRTSEALDDEIIKMFGKNTSVGYMAIMSKCPETNSLTAMLGTATHVIVTEDSVSMVSEAATAGFKVGLMRVPRITNPIKNMTGYGAQRFDELFAKMANQGLIEDLGNDPNFIKFLEPYEQKHGKDFNEAKRAAQWILESK